MITFLKNFSGVKKTATGWQSKCPAHEDKTPSLSITQAENKILLHCHSGCTVQEIVSAAGLKMSDLFFGEPKKPKQVAEYKYTDATGKHLYSVIRYHPKNFRQRAADGSWSVKGILQVTYHLPRVIDAIAKKETVYIVEGEKDVHSIEALGLCATTNAGGAGKWKLELSKYLADAAEIIILPDNDEAGRAHALKIKKSLPNAKILTLPDLPDKGDVSDWIASGGTSEKLKNLPTCETITHQKKSLQVFRCLGYNHGVYYYFPEGSKQVAAISGGNHTKSNLLTLAPLDYWQALYSYNDRISWDRAASDVMRQCEACGVYSISRHRGRGGWFDEGRSIIHLGDQILVDGSLMSEVPNSYYIYEAGDRIVHDNSNPLKKEEAIKFQKIIDSLFWKKTIYAKMLSGWCVVAPICGSLEYRPNVWLTGESGSGKSFITDSIVKPCVKSFVKYFQSNTTEAGIRQTLRTDALPIIIDEFEGEDETARIRVQKTLELARQSFSESDGKIVMGSSSGRAVEYQIRSTFFLSSIGVTLARHADETRTVVLNLDIPSDREGETKEQHFEKLRKTVAETITDKWCICFRARTFSMIKTIRANAEIFSVALASKIGSRRAGDQAGTLLAGAYSLTSDKIITKEFAEKWIDEKDWEDLKDVISRTDETECLNVILQHLDKTSHGDDYTVAELIKKCSSDLDPFSDSSEVRLRRLGIRVIDKTMYVSDSYSALKRILSRTPYERNWGRTLKRIKGAKNKKSIRFVSGAPPGSATEIPLSVIESYPETWDE